MNEERVEHTRNTNLFEHHVALEGLEAVGVIPEVIPAVIPVPTPPSSHPDRLCVLMSPVRLL